MFLYQLPVWFPGWVFFGVVMAGLVLLIRRWRGWGMYAGLAWGVAVVNLVVPIAAVELDYRYALSAVPFACLAFGLACIKKPGRRPSQRQPPLLLQPPRPPQPPRRPSHPGHSGRPGESGSRGGLSERKRRLVARR